MDRASRRGIGSIVGVVLAMLVATRTAEAQYTAAADTVAGTVTFTGSAGNDTPLVFADAAGVLTHNRTDPGFNSVADMDTTVAGDQVIMVAALTSLTINAGAGDDTVVLTALSGVPAGAAIIVNGEDGNDVLTGGLADETLNGGPGNDLIDPGASAGEANVVDGGADVDTLVLTGDLATNVITISAAGGVLSITIDGAVSTAAYGNLEVVSLTGLAGNDTVTVQPLADLSYALDGGADADTLSVDAGGAVVIQSSGSILVTGRLPINHTGMETVNVTNQGFLLEDVGPKWCGLLGIESLLLLGIAAARRARGRGLRGGRRSPPRGP